MYFILQNNFFTERAEITFTVYHEYINLDLLLLYLSLGPFLCFPMN